MLKLICWYAVLAPSGSEQITLLNTTAQVGPSARLHWLSCCLPTAPAVWYVRPGLLLTAPTPAKQDKRLEELPLYHELLQSFITKEVGPQHARGIAIVGQLSAVACTYFSTQRLLRNLLNQPHSAFPWLTQVNWWSTLSEKYTAEVQAQQDVFGGEYGEQAHTDFRCVCLPSVLAAPFHCLKPVPFLLIQSAALPHCTCPGTHFEVCMKDSTNLLSAGCA